MLKKILFPICCGVVIAAGCATKISDSDCVETKRSDVACITLYDPVCGCNNKTYGNACEAQAHGIKTFTKGECQK